MGWGDTAQQALAKAMEVYKELVQVQSNLDVLFKQIADFRVDMRGRQVDHEARVRMVSDALEARVRALEIDNAKLQGTVAASYSTAVGITILDEKFKRMEAQAKALGAAATDTGQALDEK